jgi:hypothetical protein
MGRRDKEDEWEKLKPGRLDEREHDERGLVSPRARTAQAMYIRTTSFLLGREKAPLPKAPKIMARLGAVLAGNSSTAFVSTFHMRHDFVSREPSPTPKPTAYRRGKAVAVYPYSKRQIALVKKVGSFDQTSRTYIVPIGQKFLQTRIGRRLRCETAKALRHMWLAGRSIGQSKISATEFQAYISRVGLSKEDREKALDSDEKGAIDFGTIGTTLEECNSFWRAVDRYETQERARLQSRAEFELPYWISSSCRREIVEKFGDFLTGEGLQFWAAVHRPGRLSDPRSFHLHLVYHNRQVIADADEAVRQKDQPIRGGRGDPIFAPKKNRNHQGDAWLKRLREEFASIVNDVLAREAVRTRQLPPFFFFPGTYGELGIDAVPQEHLGSRRTAIQRRGGTTRRGEKNNQILEDRVSKKIDHAIDQIEINLRRLRVKKRSTPDRPSHDNLGNELEPEFRRIRGLCELAIRGLTEIEIALSEPPTPERKHIFVGSLRKCGFFPFDLCRLHDEGANGGTLEQEELNAHPLRTQNEAAQLGQLAAIAKLFFLHQLEIAAITLQLHVVQRKERLIPADAVSRISIDQSNQMRPPPPTVSIVANEVKNLRTPGTSDLEYVSWLDVSDDWQSSAEMIGALKSVHSQQWYAPANLSPISRQKLVKFFGSIESKIAHRVAAERRIEELASQQATNSQLQASKPLVSETSHPNQVSAYSKPIAAPSSPQSGPSVQPGSTSTDGSLLTAGLHAKSHPASVKPGGATATNVQGAPPPTRSHSATAAASDLANQRGRPRSSEQQKANMNRTPLVSAPAFSPRAAERPVFRPASNPGVSSPAARAPTHPAQRPPAREDRTLSLPISSYDFGVRTSDPEVRKMYEARARKFTVFELNLAFSMTRKIAEELAALRTNGQEHRGAALQNDYISGLRLLDEEFYKRGIVFTDIEKHSRAENSAKNVAKQTEPAASTSPSGVVQQIAHKSRGGREL